MRPLKSLIAAFVAILVLTAGALAQSEPKKSPLGLPAPPGTEQATPAPSTKSPGLADRVWLWVQGMQQKLHRDMTSAVKELKAAGSLHAAWVLALVGFTYGVLHAAGPGHGKAVISSYVLANERTVRRGIFLSFLAAFLQAVSAITIVGLLAVALNATSLTISSAEHWIETVSWALVAAIGAWMLYSQLKPLLARRASATSGSDQDHRHSDPHSHGHHGHVHQEHLAPGHESLSHAHDGCCGHEHHQEHASPANAHAQAHATGIPARSMPSADHKHHEHADHSDCCGHAHMPSPKDLEGDLTWSKALAIAGSIGIRPCTGAIIVLIFALHQGMLWAGVLATFAMAFGTALTTSALAALAVGSKELATRYAGEGSRWAGHIGTAAGLTGSSLVLLLGVMFFLQSLNGPAPL